MKKTVLIFISVICFFCAVSFVVFNYLIFPLKFKTQVFAFSKKYEIDESIVFAVIKAESGFDEKAKSDAGALGLMQVMPETGEWIASVFEMNDFNSSDLLDAKTNVEFGCFYLKYLFEKFDDEVAVICAYNAGETVVRKWIGDDGVLAESEILFAETREYFKKVSIFKKIYKKRLNLYGVV